jgi:sterol desaturase/sphingolipid hydroxylase (fatty acid hydroxylase superfamily)
VTFFGLSAGALRFGLFMGIFILMASLETLAPRRKRRHARVKRWLTNFGIMVSSYVATALVALVIPVTAVVSAFYAGDHGIGLFNALSFPAWIEGAIAFVVLDFVIWAQHLVTHKIPVLWRFHRVHHTDEDLDASSAIRFHPVEIVFSVFVKSAAVVLLGAPAVAVVLFEAAVNGSALFNHANLRLPGWLDKALRTVLVTPDMHRVHHSTLRDEIDSNYGFALSIWDRAFRTYVPQPRGGHDGMVLGLADWQDDAPTRLGWVLALPFRNPPRSGGTERAPRQ